MVSSSTIRAAGALDERPLLAARRVSTLLSVFVLPALLAFIAAERRNRSILGFWLPVSEVVLGIVLRLLISRHMRFRAIDALLMPLTGSASIVITLRSMWWKSRGGYRWKGRRFVGATSSR